MPTDFTTLSLRETLAEAKAIAQDVPATFGGLNAEQLNWKPNAASWSVGQCLEHLIAANRAMFGPFDEVISGKKRTTFWERVPLLSGLFGKLMVKSLSPNAKHLIQTLSSLKLSGTKSLTPTSGSSPTLKFPATPPISKPTPKKSGAICYKSIPNVILY